MSKLFNGMTPEQFKIMRDLFIAQNRQVIEVWEGIKAAEATKLTVEEVKVEEPTEVLPEGS